MALAERRRLFEPFHTTKPGEGTGLGLHISGTSTGVLASGNVWDPIQGASATGTYGHALVSGPVAGANGNNYDIAAGGSIQF